MEKAKSNYGEPSKRGFSCFKCGKEGHYARNCEEKTSKPEEKSEKKTDREASAKHAKAEKEVVTLYMTKVTRKRKGNDDTPEVEVVVDKKKKTKKNTRNTTEAMDRSTVKGSTQELYNEAVRISETSGSNNAN